MNNEESSKNQEVRDLQQEPKNEVADERKQQLAKQGFGGILIVAAVLLIFFFIFGGDNDKSAEVKEDKNAPVVEKINLKGNNDNPFNAEEAEKAAVVAVKNPFVEDNIKLVKGLSGGSVKGRQTTATNTASGFSADPASSSSRLDAARQATADRLAGLQQRKEDFQNSLSSIMQASSQQTGAGPRPSGSYETKITESTAAVVTAKKSPLDPNLALDKGTFIPCVLKTAIVSSIAGNIACIVTDDVYSAGGTVILIEKGSIVQGSFRSGMIQPGMNRLFVIWDEIKTPGRVIINVSAPSTDPLGGSGIEGWVDNHYMQRFGGAILLSMIDDALSAAFDNKDGRDYTLNTRENTMEMANTALASTINIPPTLYKNHGDIVGIYVNKDVDFREVYHLTRIQK